MAKKIQSKFVAMLKQNVYVYYWIYQMEYFADWKDIMTFW